MGFSPQSGLENATRHGDLDVFAVLYMMERHGWSVDEVRRQLAKNGGLDPALHEYIETGRIVAAAHLPHIEIDPARNLLAAEDQLGFLFTLCLGSPHGHRDGHHDHHDADADQQRRHRVSALTALTR